MSQSDRPHALLGGSSADRWSNCPGSIFLKKKLPPRVAHEEAELGTRAHEALEVLLEAFLKHKVSGTPWPVGLSDYSPEIHEVVLKTIMDLWERVLFESITDKAYGLETKLILSGELEQYGYLDFWCVYIDDKGKKAGVVFDFKHGYYSVQAEKNAQLAFYAAALQETLRRKGKELDYIRGIIYQPRVWGEDPLRETKFTAKQLDVWKQKFFKAGHQIVVEKRPTFKVGSWCQWCDAQTICPTYLNDLSVNSSLKILNDAPAEFEFPDPKVLPDEQLSRIVLNSDRIKRFLDAAKSWAIERNLSGVPLPGTKLVETKSRRCWKKEEETIIGELTRLGVETIFKQKLLGISAIESQLSERYGKKKARELVDQHTEHTVPSLNLVPATDTGIEVKNSQKLLDEENVDE